MHTRHKVVIIGGGFAGVYTARALSERMDQTIDIEMICDRNYFVYQPLLPEVAAGTINSQDAVTPLRRLLPRVRVRLAEVIGVDLVRKQVQILQGRRRIPQQIHYEHVVLASGQVTDLSRFPGFSDHSLTMKDLSDAYRLRNQIIRCLELADVTEFPELKQQALTFVVAGGGFSGVETMGELVEMVHRTRKLYPGIGEADVRFVLVQRGDRILPEMSAKLSRYALQNLTRRGVEVKCNTALKQASASAVITDQGEVIRTSTLITTIGNGPAPFIRQLNLPLERGKIKVDGTLVVEGFCDVWALGDIARVPLADGALAPPTAQYAMREAYCVAENILKCMRGESSQPFAYKPRGMLASLGNYAGVAQLYGLTLTGLPAWLIWRGFYISMVPGISTRLRISLNWFFDYFMPRSTVYLEQGRTPACRYRYYAPGEEVFASDQLLDGLYIVMQGRLKMTGTRSDGEPFERVIEQGDHWGEWILTHSGVTTGRVEALEPTKVLVLAREDFFRLREALPGFANYFSSLDPGRYSKAVMVDRAEGYAD
ncbi:MAG: FAD-dependent oxidoreductase [Pseudomonadota bacterium]|nr:FAD-dependent oxidoreductase [Pseudomonadota bacterium]